jgi:hypothetical protein
MPIRGCGDLLEEAGERSMAARWVGFLRNAKEAALRIRARRECALLLILLLLLLLLILL